MDIIKSPLNYTGNKYRIFNQMSVYFPEKIDFMVDMFCGGATVGINVDCKKRLFIDSNKRVIGLLKFLSSSNYENLLNDLIELINKYKLSNSYEKGFAYYKNIANDNNVNNGLKKYNEVGYYKLREDYNNINNKETKKAYTYLYLLLLYAFNNDLRFSRDGKFNLPVGKTDLNKTNMEKLKMFISRMDTIDKTFICEDFRNDGIQKIIKKADFIYMDPPYLITDAFYNESGKWTEKDEKDLLNLVQYFIKHSKNFMLSNVLKKVGKVNLQLQKFISDNNSVVKVNIDYNYRSASYNKINRNANEEEIILIPKRLYDRYK